MGRWLARVMWDLLVLVTYRYPLDANRALGCWESYADRRLGGEWHEPIAWVAVTEPTFQGRPHVHALLRPKGARLTRPALTARWVERDWRGRHGLARVEPYDPGRPGARYVAKDFGRPGNAWGASRAAQDLLREIREDE